MRVLVVGSGAREHALAWKLSQSPRVTEVLVAPGNGGTARVARNVPLVDTDVAGLVSLARRERVDFTVIGPEGPIASGVADAFAEAGMRVFAPSRKASLLESSKVWAKAFMSRNQIPTAPFHHSSRFEDAVALARIMPLPLVLKASGLAAGKGVAVVESLREGEEFLRRMMVDRAFGSSGDEVVLEAFLEGREVSLLAFMDGTTAIPMPFACDYKRLEDGNRGPNTGGMGGYSPPAWLDESMRSTIMSRIFEPTIAALRAEQIDFRGVLYFGIIVTAEGPWVLEFNVRFGDPETQVLLVRLESDLMDLLEATVDGRLGDVTPRWSEDATCGVVLTSRGYPGTYETGVPVPSFEDAAGVTVFHAGTAQDGHTSAGGRVLTLVGRGADVAAARVPVYDALAARDVTAFHYRKDIGLVPISARST